MRKTSLAIALALRVFAAPAEAQLAGPELRVTTSSDGNQSQPAVAGHETAFVVAWRDETVSPFSSVLAQRSHANGTPLGGAFRVSSAPAGPRFFPSAAWGSSTTSFVIVWEVRENLGDETDPGIFAQRYSSAGMAEGAEFRVNTYTSASNFSPDVSADSSGRFVVVWTDERQVSAVGVTPQGLPPAQLIQGRRFNSSGNAVAEFIVESTTGYSDFSPNVSVVGGPGGLGSPAGNFAVTWTRSGAGGDGSGVAVFARRWSVLGLPIGAEFQVNEATTGYQGRGDVAALPNGQFVFVWQSDIGTDIVARRFPGVGSALTSDFRVNTVTTGRQSAASIAADPNGDFLIVWQTPDGADDGISGQLYASSGGPIGTEFRISTTTTGKQNSPRLAATGAGKFMVTWTSYAALFSPGDVLGQRLNRNGDANGDGKTDVLDVFYLINFLFAAGPPPVGPADVNGTDGVTVVDVFHLINFLFAGGAPPV
jgi:hypothetical protein